MGSFGRFPARKGTCGVCRNPLTKGAAECGHCKVPILAKSKGSKFGNVKTEDGYDSRREARRAQVLRIMEKAGEISELREQVRYELVPKQDGERSVHYVADFSYRQNGELVVEDVKSEATKTPVYILKRKLLLFRHGIRIKEV